MGYLKTLLSKDIIITPFRVHKQFSYTGTPPGYNVDGVSVFTGENTNYPLGGGEKGTGSAALVFNSIKQLYYSNYISSSNGLVNTASLPQYNPDGTVIGSSYTPNYINNIQSIDERRYFPTGDEDIITVLSIPSKQFGEYIKPGSLTATGLFDDGQGNLKSTVDESSILGNIIYKAGLAIHTGLSGSGEVDIAFENPQWESTVTIYETQYKCTIRSNEYNYSLNPSLLKDYGSDLILKEGKANYKNFVTSSDFSPYVTTVGLYDDDQNLLAVAKLAQPLATSQTTDTIILINLDR